MKIIRKLLFFVILLLVFFTIFESESFASYDPLSRPNNKFGIHILFPDEIEEASKLVNSNGGQWGYVVIPIQSYDKNIEKWQKFMNDAKRLKIIPIIRLATNGDYFNTKVWEKPKFEHIVDFANFLDSLDWPTQNRYVAIFNEPNRSDEWGGDVNPREYAQVLSFAVTIFKSRNSDFFIISAGLDNAAANIQGQSLNEYNFVRLMNIEVPGIFNQVDGFGSHSYPNPAFSKSPLIDDSESIYSFKYEKNLAESLSSKTLPVFITETGWTNDNTTEENRGKFYETAFENAWSDSSIALVAPFLLKAQTEPFSKFSFYDKSNNFTPQYKSIQGIRKTAGSPLISTSSATSNLNSQKKVLSAKDFSDKDQDEKSANVSKALYIFLKWVMNF